MRRCASFSRRTPIMHYWRAAKAGRSAKIVPIRGNISMATERKFAKKLPLTMAFTVLLVAAFGAGCKGFFQAPTLSSIAIQPPTPQIQVGPTTTATLQAYGTYSPDDTRSLLTSG